MEKENNKINLMKWFYLSWVIVFLVIITSFGFSYDFDFDLSNQSFKEVTFIYILPTFLSLLFYFLLLRYEYYIENNKSSLDIGYISVISIGSFLPIINMLITIGVFIILVGDIFHDINKKMKNNDNFFLKP